MHIRHLSSAESNHSLLFKMLKAVILIGGPQKGEKNVLSLESVSGLSFTGCENANAKTQCCISKVIFS